MFGAISFLFGIMSTIYTVIKSSKNSASSFMNKELNTYYLGTKGIL